MTEKVVVSWSSGKDSAMMLHELKANPNYEVVALLTTVTEDFDRISMHGVRTELLERQAEALGLPLVKVMINTTADNTAYQKAMGATLARLQGQGVSTVAIGDIYLEDLKKYREENLAKIGMKAVFPIWGKDTHDLSRQFCELGYKAIITCVDTQILESKFSGRQYDAQFLSELLPVVDPCGENGEFHSFAYDGPIFKHPINFKKGEVVLRDERYCFCDLIPE